MSGHAFVIRSLTNRIIDWVVYSTGCETCATIDKKDIFDHSDKIHDATSPNNCTDAITIDNRDTAISEGTIVNGVSDKSDDTQSPSNYTDDTSVSDGDTAISKGTIVNGVFDGSHNVILHSDCTVDITVVNGDTAISKATVVNYFLQILLLLIVKSIILHLQNWELL